MMKGAKLFCFCRPALTQRLTSYSGFRIAAACTSYYKSDAKTGFHGLIANPLISIAIVVL
jgi:hypothetical protein